jgi:hypothetical protein
MALTKHPGLGYRETCHAVDGAELISDQKPDKLKVFAGRRTSPTDACRTQWDIHNLLLHRFTLLNVRKPAPPNRSSSIALWHAGVGE